MLTEIQILRELAEYVKRNSHDGHVRHLLKQLDECAAKREKDHREYLERNGRACVICGKKFLPLDFDHDDIFCSVGCSFK